MISKTLEKETAIAMRREGKTYSEIRMVVPVSKSSLSLWFKEVSLSTPQKQTLTAKKLAAAKNGGLAKRRQRIERNDVLFSAAVRDIGVLSDRELFLVGVALYWAEGTKQKEHTVSQPVIFANSDPRMIQCFLRWLDILNVPQGDRVFNLYIHPSGDVEAAVRFWAETVGVTEETIFERVYFKNGNPKTNRKNIGSAYRGLLRVGVKRSTDLNRRLSGWAQGIVLGCF